MCMYVCVCVTSSGLNANSSQGQAVELKFYSLILESSVGFWVGIQSAGDFVSQTSKVRILHGSSGLNAHLS